MANTEPSDTFIDVVKKIKRSRSAAIRVAEIGVDRGATTLEVIKILDLGDRLDLFDVSNCPFVERIDELRRESKCDIHFHGNSRAIFDSYAWTIARQFTNEIRYGNFRAYDAVYLDGAHTFHVDAPTTCLVKEMIAIGGYLVFDDVLWTLERSPTCGNAETQSRYSADQFKSPHVEVIVDAFMRSDSRFIEVTNPREPRAVFVRRL